MTVLAIDPRREADVALIRAVARSCQSLILVVVPGPHSQGVTGALEAGADVCVRESDSVATIRYTIPMPEDSPLRGGDAEEVALGSPVLSTVQSGGPTWTVLRTFHWPVAL